MTSVRQELKHDQSSEISLMANRRAIFLTTTIVGILGCLGTAIVHKDNLNDVRDLVRIRNAVLLHDPIGVTVDWAPENRPAEFLWEDTSVLWEDSPNFIDATQTESANLVRFNRAISIARHLVKSPNRDGLPIQRGVREAYERITQDGTGYCADYTQVFNALAISNNIPVREWGMSFDAYGGDGHAFNEVFDSSIRQWIFVDSFYSFYVTGRDGKPLSVTEFMTRLKNGENQDSIDVVRIEPDRFLFPSDNAALDYYKRGAENLYLWWGNNSISYDRNKLVKFASLFGRGFEQSAAILAGIHPKIVIPKGFASSHDVGLLHRISFGVRALMFFAVLTVLGGLLALLQAFMSAKADSPAGLKS